MKRILMLMFAVLVVYLTSGVYVVQPDEMVVVRRFGRMLSVPRSPGLHIGLPWGMDRIDRLKPNEVKRVTIGSIRVGADAVGSSSLQYLTGDRNLVHIRATVQYAIGDPASYLYRSATVDMLIAQAGAAALTSVLAGEPVDRVLTQGKQQMAILAVEQLQRRVDQYGLGVLIRSMDIGAAQPPAEVAEAFDSVIAAQRLREQQINEAHSYANRILAAAQADAQRAIDRGRAERDQRIREAEGETERFEKLLVQYQRAPELTAQRMYLESMAETLPRFRAKLIMDADTDLDLSILREDSP